MRNVTLTASTNLQVLKMIPALWRLMTLGTAHIPQLCLQWSSLRGTLEKGHRKLDRTKLGDLCCAKRHTCSDVCGLVSAECKGGTYFLRKRRRHQPLPRFSTLCEEGSLHRRARGTNKMWFARHKPIVQTNAVRSVSLGLGSR